jgi:ferrous iron transport protein B
MTAPLKNTEQDTGTRRVIRAVLAGNPNCGKTSLFNGLTGSRQRVGNYPGVTVEKREGRWRQGGVEVQVRDLPGAYSLTSYSPEERIARDELLASDHDVVVVVVDSTVLRRSLVFALQVLQLDANVVLCLNMADEARRSGQRIDTRKLGRLLGVPVVETAAHRGEGLDALRAAVLAAASQPRRRPAPEIAAVLADTRTIIDQGSVGDDDASLRRSQRFAITIAGILDQVTLAQARPNARALSDRIDSVVAHRWLGLPIFLAVMYAVFWLTFTLGEAPMGWIETGVERLAGGVTGAWPGSPDSPLLSLIVDGVIGGVGGVLVFLPNIVLLFLGLSLLEDTGYMARAAYLMDRYLSRVGLHGKSFLPLVTGFGCSIPGIMATRTIENERDRLVTMLVLPLMSCGARLPIWMLIIPALFAPGLRAPMMWAIYIFGVLLAMGLALVLRGTILRGEPTPFVLEMPPYRLPTWRAVISRMAERSGMYLRKAGTVILGISILLWALTSYPKTDTYAVDAAVAGGAAYTEQEIAGMRAAEDLQHSVAGRIGAAIEPAFRPLGFDWRIVTATIGAFAAKEVFVSQMSIVYALGEDGAEADLQSRLRRDFSPRVGIALMIFLLVGTPCMATVAVVRRESGSWRWAWGQFFGLTMLAYILALTAYGIGGLI